MKWSKAIKHTFGSDNTSGNQTIAEASGSRDSGRQQGDVGEPIIANGAISKPRYLVLIYVKNEHLDVPGLLDCMSDSSSA